jgi:hypothetical protein
MKWLPIILQGGALLSVFLTLLGYCGVLLTMDKSDRAFMWSVVGLFVGMVGLFVSAMGIYISYYILRLF